jgi:arylsulfatase
LDAKNWELYHVADDFAENHNVAAENRPKLIEMIAQWYVEAGKYDVLPVDGRGTQRFVDQRPQISLPRDSCTYYPGTQMIPTNACPSVLNRPHSITADAEIPLDGSEGVLLSAGDVQGGYAFYVQDHKLHYVYNYVGSNFYHIESSVIVPRGRHKLRFEFEVTGKPDIPSGKGAPGRGQLYIDGKLVGQGDIPLTMPLALGLAGGIVCGADTGSPVWDKYTPPFKFTGTLYSVTVDVSGELIKDTEAEMRMAMARQ